MRAGYVLYRALVKHSYTLTIIKEDFKSTFINSKKCIKCQNLHTDLKIINIANKTSYVDFVWPQPYNIILYYYTIGPLAIDHNKLYIIATEVAIYSYNIISGT